MQPESSGGRHGPTAREIGRAQRQARRRTGHQNPATHSLLTNPSTVATNPARRARRDQTNRGEAPSSLATRPEDQPSDPTWFAGVVVGDLASLAASPNQRCPTDPELLSDLGDRQALIVQLGCTVKIDPSALVVASLHAGSLHHRRDRSAVEAEQHSDLTQSQTGLVRCGDRFDLIERWRSRGARTVNHRAFRTCSDALGQLGEFPQRAGDFTSVRVAQQELDSGPT